VACQSILQDKPRGRLEGWGPGVAVVKLTDNAVSEVIERGSSRGIRRFAVRGASVGDVVEGDPLPRRPCSWVTMHGDLGRHRER